MLYVVRYVFRDGADDARANARAAHLDYLKDAGNRLKLAGPVAAGHAEVEGEANAAAEGSLLIIDADSLTAARLFAQSDPYYKADIVETLKVKAFKAVLGDWIL
jgi:hypothetical protein